LRDQLHDDGYDIYVKKVDGESRTRTTLIKDVLEDVSDAEDVEELEDLGTDSCRQPLTSGTSARP